MIFKNKINTFFPLGNFKISFITNLLVYLLALAINGYPILIMDSWRYSANDPVHFAGSVLPKVFSYPLTIPFGDYGFVTLTCILISYSVARLISAGFKHILPNFTLLSAYRIILISIFINVLGFVPFFAILVASEPWSMAAMLIIIACLIERKITFFDALIIILTSAAHGSNLLVVFPGLIVFWILVRDRQSFLLCVYITIFLFLSTLLDLALYKSLRKDSWDRLTTAFFGAELLEHYQFVFDEECNGGSEFILCQSPYLEHIRKHRDHNSFRSSFLWKKDSLGMYSFHNSTLPLEYKLTTREFNIASGQFLKPFILSHLTHPKKIFAIHIEEIKKLIVAEGITSRDIRWGIKRKYSWKSPNLLSSICVKHFCYHESFLIITLVQLVSALSLSVIFIFRCLGHSNKRDLVTVVLVLFVYLLNLAVSGIIGVPDPRYHYRFFALVPFLILFLLFHLPRFKSKQM